MPSECERGSVRHIAVTTKQWRYFAASNRASNPTQIKARPVKHLDQGSQNPRMQCSVCGRWMRLHGKRLEVVDGQITEVAVQRFFGSCSHSGGGDHLAGDHADVCHVCCERECKAIAAKAA